MDLLLRFLGTSGERSLTDAGRWREVDDIPPSACSSVLEVADGVSMAATKPSRESPPGEARNTWSCRPAFQFLYQEFKGGGVGSYKSDMRYL